MKLTDYLNEVKARCEKATPPPWNLFSSNDVLKVSKEGSRPIVNWSGFDDSRVSTAQRLSNAMFIAFSRQDVPTLIKILNRTLNTLNEYSYGDGCICGDGLGHGPAVKALADIEKMVGGE